MKNKKKTPLWSFQNHSKDSTSYILGTMHVRDQRAFSLFDVCKEKIETCDAFFTEVHMELLDNPMTLNAQELSSNTSLKILLGEKFYKKSKQVIKTHFSVNLDLFNHLLPILTQNQLLAMHLSKDHPLPLDQSLYQKAKTKGCSIKGLETMGEHLAVLKTISLEEQIRQFKQFIKNAGKYKKKITQMANIYMEGDIYKLYKISKMSMGKMRRTMIYNRNYAMVDEILKHVDSNCFYAFGAGHLAGKHGILRLLKMNGIKCVPIQQDH